MIFIGSAAFRDECKHKTVHSTALCGLSASEIRARIWSIFICAWFFITISRSIQLFSCSFNLKCNHAFTLFTGKSFFSFVFLLHVFHACMQFTPATFIHKKNFLVRAVNSSHFFHSQSLEKGRKKTVSQNKLAHAKHAILIKFHSRNVSTALEAAFAMNGGQFCKRKFR